MKVQIKDLRKAIEWIYANSPDVVVSVSTQDQHMYLACSDKSGANVEIKLFVDGTMQPKIRKEDVL